MGSASESLRDLIRAAGGGLLVGLPLLFTMEMWWHGFLLPAWKIAVLLAVAFVVVVGYTTLTGFRRDRSWTQLLVDTVQTFGIGAVIALVALVAMGRIDTSTQLRDAIGQVSLETIPVAFGVSLAGAQLAAPEEGSDAGGSPTGDRAGVGILGRLFVAAGAALLFALNVAPTQELLVIAVEADWWLMLLTMAASVLATLGIVFYADFRGGRGGPHPRGTWRSRPLEVPIGETLAAYAVSLLVAALLIWAFGWTSGMPLDINLRQVVVLGVVASIGAAAGRLLVGDR
jgi:putative integral membrane protein (TIGR02587 family)